MASCNDPDRTVTVTETFVYLVAPGAPEEQTETDALKPFAGDELLSDATASVQRGEDEGADTLHLTATLAAPVAPGQDRERVEQALRAALVVHATAALDSCEALTELEDVTGALALPDHRLLDHPDDPDGVSPVGRLNTAEAQRMADVMRAAHVTSTARDYENFVTVLVDDAEAERLGTHPALWISSRGRVAAASVNQPPYYDTFDELVAR